MSGMILEEKRVIRIFWTYTGYKRTWSYSNYRTTKRDYQHIDGFQFSFITMGRIPGRKLQFKELSKIPEVQFNIYYTNPKAIKSMC